MLIHLPGYILFIILSSSILASSASENKINVDLKKTLIWGPGLNPKIVLPVRYFYLQVVDKNGSK